MRHVGVVESVVVDVVVVKVGVWRVEKEGKGLCWGLPNHAFPTEYTRGFSENPHIRLRHTRP